MTAISGFTGGTLLALAKRENKRQWQTGSAIAVAYQLKGWKRQKVLDKFKDNDLGALATQIGKAWSPMDKFQRIALPETVRTTILASDAETAVTTIVDEIDRHMKRLNVKSQGDYYKVCGFKTDCPDVRKMLEPVPAESGDYDDPPAETEPEGDEKSNVQTADTSVADKDNAERSPLEEAKAIAATLDPSELLELATWLNQRMADMNQTEEIQEQKAAA